MALVKNEKQKEEKAREFDEFLEARAVFENADELEERRLSALDYIVEHKEIKYVLRMLHELFLNNNLENHIYIDYAFSSFVIKPKRDSDFAEMFEMLKSDNAYLRNQVIIFIQNFGKEAKEFMKKLLSDSDKDIRIFAINILGDVRFDDSVDMLRYFLVQEGDINAMMTAVDYLGEIGNADDIELLESIKASHEDNPFVVFGVDMAVERLRG